jgi:hypothetical protein
MNDHRVLGDGNITQFENKDRAMDELRNKIAAQLLERYRNGEISLDDGEVGVDNKALREAAEYDLAQIIETFGGDAYSSLSEMHPKWAHERIISLCDGVDDPTLSEIRQHMAVVFSNDEDGRFLVMVEKLALKQGSNIVGWAVIRETGIALDRDYEVAFIGSTQEDASKFIYNYFRSSD